MAEKGEALSERELEVLQCVVEGAGNKEIAAALVISHNTVKVHLRNIFTKLGVSSRTEATAVALQQGLVTLAGITTEASDGDALAKQKPESEERPTRTPAEPLTPTALPRRPVFFPKQAGFILLLLLLLTAVVLVYNTLVQPEPPPPTPVPFTETPITDDWLQSRALPAGRANMALVGNGLNLYLIGGETAEGVTRDVAIFNTTELDWRSGASKPTAVTEITGAELFGEIYIPGGKLANGQPTSVVEVYSPANDSWRVATPLPTAVSGGLVLSDGSFLYYFGGWNGQNVLANVYRFDPAANNWQILPDMATARAFVTGGLVRGKLYVVGGYDGERPLTECAYFDPGINTDEDPELEGSWGSCANTLLPRAGASAAGLLNKLYVFGGGAFSDEPIAFSESYNPDSDQWSIVNTPALSDPPDWTYLGITNIEIKIYAVGGRRGETISDAVFAYKPLAYQTFIPIAPVDGGGP